MNGKLKALDLLEIKDIAPRCKNNHLVGVVSGDSLVGKAGTQGTLHVGIDSQGTEDRDIRDTDLGSYTWAMSPERLFLRLNLPP